jgi:RNA polymerase sigma-70 factor (ECF subfamily)
MCMEFAGSPGRVFLTQLGESSLPTNALETQLRLLWERGRDAWTDIELSPDDFARALAESKPEDQSIEEFFAGVQTEGLYLARACGLGRPRALADFEARYMSQVPLFLSRLSPSPALVEEVQQILRAKLFVAADGERPKIFEYSGLGSLPGWFRAVTLRTALSLLRRRADLPLEEPKESATAFIPDDDPELRYIIARYRQDFEQAFRTAIGLLPTDKRNLLRLYFIDGLSIDKLGALYQVHRATAARWLQSLREEVLRDTRRLLQERLKLSVPELDSMIRLLHGQLDLSLTGALRALPA